MDTSKKTKYRMATWGLIGMGYHLLLPLGVLEATMSVALSVPLIIVIIAVESVIKHRSSTKKDIPPTEEALTEPPFVQV